MVLGERRKRYGSASHAGAYSKKTVSLPCILLLLTRPTGRVRPSNVNMNFNVGHYRSAGLSRRLLKFF